ncbi:Uncharacterized protein Adt_05580 [Abeliophyllum distichum]|uniref:Uncharacterized protein n=1 Tax=Abeliophyllum distichum TaxID=126358 RepID=A0ABD1V4H0_9LAMI
MDVYIEQADEEMILDESLDSRIIGPDSSASPMKELEAFLVNPSDPSQMLQHNDMVGIDPSVACHDLKVDPKVCPRIQKRRPLSTKRYGALKKEVDKLLAIEFIKEAVYLKWVSNPVLVRKNNKK